MKTAHIYYHDDDGKKADILYKGVYAIKAGSALQVLGKDDCRGNGIRESAPVIQLKMDNGTTATFDADNVTILL